MLIAKIDVNLPTIKGDSALHFALRSGHTQCAALLLDSRADPGLQNEVCDDNGLNGISVVAHFLCRLVARIHLTHNSCVRVQTNQTPMEQCKTAQQRDEFTQILRDRNISLPPPQMQPTPVRTLSNGATSGTETATIPGSGEEKAATGMAARMLALADAQERSQGQQAATKTNAQPVPEQQPQSQPQPQVHSQPQAQPLAQSHAQPAPQPTPQPTPQPIPQPKLQPQASAPAPASAPVNSGSNSGQMAPACVGVGEAEAKTVPTGPVPVPANSGSASANPVEQARVERKTEGKTHHHAEGKTSRADPAAQATTAATETATGAVTTPAPAPVVGTAQSLFANSGGGSGFAQ